MLKFYNSLSPATKLLIQSFLAVLGAALAGAATAAYQSYITSSQLNLQLLLNVTLVTFTFLFGKAMHDWIPGHAQQLIQAYQDNEARLHDALQRQQNISSAVIATQGSLVQSTSPQSQQQPVLKAEDVMVLSQQLAVNLLNMTANNSKVATSQANIPLAPAQDAYEDPLYVSMKLPAYTSLSSGALASATALQPQNPQASFQIPARPATMP